MLADLSMGPPNITVCTLTLPRAYCAIPAARRLSAYDRSRLCAWLKNALVVGLVVIVFIGYGTEKMSRNRLDEIDLSALGPMSFEETLAVIDGEDLNVYRVKRAERDRQGSRGLQTSKPLRLAQSRVQLGS